MRNADTLLIRADAGRSIGVGHVMRCLALAQEWQDEGGRIAFLLGVEVPELEARINAEGMQIFHLSAQVGSAQDAEQTVRQAHESAATWVVLDGYQFDSRYQKTIKDAGLRLLCIDDYGHTKHYFADLVLNQNLSGDERLYVKREPYTELLLGTRYVLIRREFLTWRGQPRQISPKVRKILVTLGGSDPANATSMALQALAHLKIPEMEVKIVIGPANPNLELLQQEAAGIPCLQLVSNTSDMPGLMAWADVAVAAAGSTSWELAFMGLPSLLLTVADNQRPVAERLEASGAAINLGESTRVTADALAGALSDLMANQGSREDMSRRAQLLVDGEGAGRVIMQLYNESFCLRRATILDERVVWEWANDPVVRASSFSMEPIPWEQHVRWYRSKICDPNYVIYIAVSRQDEMFGQVRFELDGTEAIISIGLAAEFRGQGYGSAMIRRASERLLRTRKIELIRAYVKPDNPSSARAFVKAGYQETEPITIKGHQALQFTYSKEEQA